MYAIPFLDIPPLLRASGTVRLPGSKSISNRVLLLAGLSDGTTTIHDLLDSDDTQVMLNALRSLGCGVEPVGRRQAAVRITGLGGRLSVHQAALFLGNAGTAMRPLTAALAMLAATQNGSFELSGVPRMHERPIGDLVDALRPLGCRIDYLGQPGFPPLKLQPGVHTASGAIDLCTPIRVRGDVSSQFLTALLMSLPLLCATESATIEIDGELISKPYIDITLDLLARFGIAVQRDGWKRFVIPAGSRYRSPAEIHVEGDASSASYFIALGAVAATDAPLRIEGVGLDSIQGDIRFVDAARAMGAQVSGGAGWIEVRRGRWPLAAIELDCNHIPDAAMTLAVMALYADGTSRLTNIASWRVKETDRIAAMATELRKLGAAVVEGADHIDITPPTHWLSAAIHTYDDHRVAMCFALAAYNALAARGAAQPPAVAVRILDPQCVGKTFPDYFETLFSVAQTDTAWIPVITIDGPTASGKGTVASALSKRLGYHALDSGALYRATAVACIDAHTNGTDEAAIAALASALDLHFEGGRVYRSGVDITARLRLEDVGALASQIAALPLVRQALLQLQLSHRRLPGLVADGRDMGTVVFADADLKIYLTASAEARACRRFGQVQSAGVSTTLESLLADLKERDSRDKNRAIAPLHAAATALLLDNSTQSIDVTVDAVAAIWEHRRPFV
jgi:3-phosphoshikimate 1-carboxyvinyltransferase